MFEFYKSTSFCKLASSGEFHSSPILLFLYFRAFSWTAQTSIVPEYVKSGTFRVHLSVSFPLSQILTLLPSFFNSHFSRTQDWFSLSFPLSPPSHLQFSFFLFLFHIPYSLWFGRSLTSVSCYIVVSFGKAASGRPHISFPNAISLPLTF